MQDITSWEFGGSYINHLEDERYILRCFRSKEPSKQPIAVVTSPQGDHIVTIFGVNCYGDQEFFTGRFYMFSKEKQKWFGSTSKVLAFGIFPRESNEWCRYDICINNCIFSPPMKFVKLSQLKPDANQDLFRWSERGIPVKPLKDYRDQDHQDIAAEYVSIGNPKFVLVCYHNDKDPIVRNTLGQHLVTIGKEVCPPDNFIQTFHVFTMKKYDKYFPEVIDNYQLTKSNKEGDYTDSTQLWCHGSESEVSNERMFYYFIAQSSSRMCYWKKIITEQRTTCPSLPHDAMILSRSKYSTIRKGAAAVAMYENLLSPTITLTCFKTKTNVKYLSVVTDSKGKHLVTITNMDCSSKANFDRRFFVQYTSINEDMKSFLVSRRWSVNDDWCTYSMYKTDMVTGEGDPIIRKWVYYDYNPKVEDLPWEEIDLHHCPGLEKSRIVLDHTESPLEELLTARHLWPTYPIKDSLLLYCYKNSREDARAPWYTNLIKTLNGKVIASINGIDCLYKKNKDTDFYIIKQKIEEKNYLIIGTRSSSEEEWCQYDVCMDCEKQEARRHFEDFGFIPDGIKWSEAGVKLGGGLVPGYDPSNVKKQYVGPWSSKYVLVCMKSEKEGEYKWIFRRARETQIANINIDLECSEVKRRGIRFYLQTKCHNGESHIYTHSFDGCELNSGSETETWIFYFVNQGGYSFEEDEKIANPNLCGAIKRENILTKEPDPYIEELSTYWNGGNPRITMICYRTTTKPYAVIKSDGNRILTLKDFDCHDKKTIVQKLYIRTTSGYKDTSQVVVGSRMYKTSGWCFYRVATKEEKNNVWVDYDYEPDELALQWYQEGSCPAVPREKIIFNRESNGNGQDTPWSLKQTFVLTTSKEYKILYCYLVNNDYISVLKSVKGNHELTIEGVNCLKPVLYINYMEIGEKTYLVLWTRKSTDWCRYDICLNCHKPDDIQFNIDDIQFNIDDHPKYSNKWAMAKQTTVQVYDTRDNEKDLDFWRSRRYRSNSAAHLMETDRWIRNVHRDKLHIIPTVKLSSIPNINENQEKSALIAKFATNDDSKFQLHSYMQKDTGTYFAVITDANGEHIVTASNQDCSSRFTENLELIKDGTIVEGVIILKTGTHYYAICWKCETSFIIKKENYYNSDIHNWKEIPLDDCPLLKREDIFIEENKFVVDESKFVARYVNNGGEEKRMFMLHCYSTGDTDNKNEYLSVLRNLEGSHLLSIKGLDCSSSEQLNSVSYISIKFGMEEMIYLGTQANTRSLPYPSCQYAISTTSKVISKVDNYLIFYKDFFEWSEAGIKMPREWCPTAKLEAFGDFFRSTTLAEYAEKELNIFGLDCYKPESQNDYYLQLRISKGIHIVTIPSSRDCKKKENLIKQFYVTKNTKTQKHLFKMDHPDITYLIESCWNVQSNEEITDIWFYHFLIKKSYDNMWKLQNEQDKNCPAIMKSDITLTKQSLEEGGTKAEYRNGGNKRVTLVCHDCQPSNFATVSSSVNDPVLKIYKLNCFDETQLYEKIYVDIDDFGIIVVGSRKSIDDAWCWYSFYQPGDKIEHAWTFYNYRPNTIVAQWYKKESEGCNAVKSEQILTKDNDLSLDNRRFHSMYIVDISYNCLDESYRCKQEILYNYCYYMGNAGGNRRYVMDITNVKGGHLATLTDFDCTSFDLAKNSYMFTMRESGYSDYLAVGTRTDSEDGWCQYDICVDCKPKEVRTNINTQKIRNGREINLYWEKATSLKCRAVKSENIFTNEDKKNEDNKNLQSVFVMKVMVHMNRGYLKLGEFLNYCFYEQGVDGTRQYMLVIRTTKGLHLATIKDFDCFPDAPLSLPDKTYMFQLTDSGNDYLALGTRTSTKDEWCQYDICLNCKTTFIRRNVYRESHYGLRIFQWKPVVLVKNYLTQSDESKEVVVQEKWDNTMKLIAKYESGGFKLDCYQDCRSSKYTYTSVVFDPDGKKIAELLEHDCYSVEKLREKLTIFIPKTIENEDDAKCLLIDFSSSSLPNNYKCCTHTECIECNKQIIESVNEEIIIKGKWVKVPTETCYSMPQESIFTVSSEVNLNGYNALATYINKGHSDEDTFVLVCYQNDNLNKGDRIMSHLKSLNGQHVVYIRNLDCLSENTLSRVSYMTVMKEYRYLKNFGTKEYRYLVLGTRSTMEEGNGPWCRYDICISCSNTDIRVNAADDPGSLKPFKWSMAGLKLTTPEENTCEGQQISSSTIVSRHVNVNYLEFSIECHYLSDPQAKDYCSVLKRHETPLVTFAKTDCATNYALKRNFYLYTLYKDFEFSLIRLDQTKYLLEKSTEKESIKEHWLYYFERKEETKTTDWVMVTNPKKWTIESIDFQESEEKKDCLPQSKKLSDLKAP